MKRSPKAKVLFVLSLLCLGKVVWDLPGEFIAVKIFAYLTFALLALGNLFPYSLLTSVLALPMGPDTDIKHMTRREIFRSGAFFASTAAVFFVFALYAHHAIRRSGEAALTPGIIFFGTFFLFLLFAAGGAYLFARGLFHKDPPTLTVGDAADALTAEKTVELPVTLARVSLQDLPDEREGTLENIIAFSRDYFNVACNLAVQFDGNILRVHGDELLLGWQEDEEGRDVEKACEYAFALLEYMEGYFAAQGAATIVVVALVTGEAAFSVGQNTLALLPGKILNRLAALDHETTRNAVLADDSITVRCPRFAVKKLGLSPRDRSLEIYQLLEEK